MSTKNLARTVIEGGRANWNQFDRRHRTAVERRRTHELERQLCSTAEADSAYFPPRSPERRVFYDKLRPALRWLHSQTGRPWDKVRSELFERFDIRTTAGRHIVFDHLLRELDPVTRYRPGEFWISRHGILRYEAIDKKALYPSRHLQPLPEPESALHDWFAGRRVIERGTRLYWLVPTAHGGFRQHHELAASDARRFRSLPAWFREGFEGAPPRSEETRPS